MWSVILPAVICHRSDELGLWIENTSVARSPEPTMSIRPFKKYMQCSEGQPNSKRGKNRVWVHVHNICIPTCCFRIIYCFQWKYAKVYWTWTVWRITIYQGITNLQLLFNTICKIGSEKTVEDTRNCWSLLYFDLSKGLEMKIWNSTQKPFLYEDLKTYKMGV